MVDPAFPVRAAHHSHGLLHIVTLGRSRLHLADLSNTLIVEDEGLGAVRPADRLEDRSVSDTRVGVGPPGRGDRVDQVVQPTAETLLDEAGDLILHRVRESITVEEDQVPPGIAGDIGGGCGAVPAGRRGTPRGGSFLEGHRDAADTGELESGKRGREAVTGGEADIRATGMPATCRSPVAGSPPGGSRGRGSPGCGG